MNILSLHSQVVAGHVGNGAAVLPLQLLGFEVWAVPTVLYSNHPGHGTFTGRVTPADEMTALIDGLDRRGLLKECDGVLVGYMGDRSHATVAAETIARVRAQNPNAAVCCDPILGDRDTGIYVVDGVADAVGGELLPCADIATPNHFELETLTGATIGTLNDALAATGQLRARGPAMVVCSSLRREDAQHGSLETLVTTPDGAWIVRNAEVDDPPHGTGDMLAALILGHTIRGEPPEDAARLAVSAVWSIIAASAGRADKELALVDAFENVTAPQFSAEIERLA